MFIDNKKGGENLITIDIQKSKKCNGEYSMYLSFPYNTTILDIVRSMPERYWHKDSKLWEIPIKKLSSIINALQDYDISITGELVAPFEKQEITTDISNFEFKTKPFEHQLEGFNYGLSHNCWLLADEQGLGKTKQVIDIAVAKKSADNFKHCLIVCGVNGLKWNWLNEIQTHSNECGHILGQRTKNGKISIGSNKDKLKDLQNIGTIDEFFLITNVESLRDDDISLRLKELCKSGVIGLVAIDEIHKCKNPSSQQGKGILKLLSKYRIAMTGTPLMNTPLDLYIILKWLGYEKHPFYAFKNHYAVMGGFGGYEVVGYRHLDDLQEQLNEFMLRRLKEDVFDLPDKLFVNEYVEMTGKQEQIYKEVSMDIKANIDKIETSPNPLAELIRMRQATGYTGILSSTIKESAKLDRMEELVDEAVSSGKKVVIFSNWTQMTDAVQERLQSKYCGAIITGETKDAERQKMVDMFQNDDDVKFIVGTVGAMGTGLTLTAGTVEIFLDEPWNMALKEQAIDRCHRIGTTQNVTIYTLMCKNTIDERIHDLVEKKGAMSDALVDGKITGNKKELLDFLLN